MNIKQAIEQRHSVRQYKDLPIKAEDKTRLQSVIDECNQKSGLSIQLVCDDPECFDTFLSHYGKFRNVNNYIALVGKKSTANLDEIAGYYGQRIVLEAQMAGLNTCWVAGTYSKGKCKVDTASGERLVCVIAIGYGENSGSAHKSKPTEKLCTVPEENMPDWFKDGLKAAILAPTAVNQQRFTVSLEDGEPVIKAKLGPMTKLDLGIVKYNFEAASGHKCR